MLTQTRLALELGTDTAVSGAESRGYALRRGKKGWGSQVACAASGLASPIPSLRRGLASPTSSLRPGLGSPSSSVRLPSPRYQRDCTLGAVDAGCGAQK